MPAPRFIADLIRRREGAVAAEFALVLPAFLALTLGSLGVCTVMYGMAALHYAVEEGARCASVKATVCGDGAAAVAYAANAYRGPSMDLTFTPSVEACGNRMTAAGVFAINTGFGAISIPISATACYPLNS